MTTLAREVSRLRRFLRDPDANIWSDALLLGLWGEVQRNVQTRLQILETGVGLPVPPAWQYSYTYDWEWALLPEKTAYKCFRQQGDFTVTAAWELQVHAGLIGNTPDPGDAYTHPWEAFASSPGQAPKWPLPADFHEMRGIYHDRLKIEGRQKSELTAEDHSWHTTTGTPWAYYRDNPADNAITLYPRPAPNWSDDAGSGPLQYVDGDPSSTQVGAILYGDGVTATSESGASVSYISEDDTIWIYYRQRPTSPKGWGDEVEFPAYLHKYIRYGVLARAYSANTDGKIPSLAAFWAGRYQAGLKAIELFKLKRLKPAHGFTARAPQRQHPRLPSSYPRQWP